MKPWCHVFRITSLLPLQLCCPRILDWNRSLMRTGTCSDTGDSNYPHGYLRLDDSLHL